MLRRKKKKRNKVGVFRCYSKNFHSQSRATNFVQCQWWLLRLHLITYDWIFCSNHSGRLRRGVSPREKIMFLTTAPLLNFSPGTAPRPIDKTLYILHKCEANKHRARFNSINLSKFIYIYIVKYQQWDIRENYEKIYVTWEWLMGRQIFQSNYI